MNTLPAVIGHPMSPKIKKKWIKALKSGKYAKGRKSLRTNNYFDPFGVLCDTLYPKDWQTFNQLVYLPPRQATQSTPDLGPRYKAKVFYANSSFGKVAHVAQLSKETLLKIEIMNDIENKSFEEIAEWIKENL